MKKKRLYARLRFSDSHIKAHRCRACGKPVHGAYVAAVHRGGRGNWLFDPFHPSCATEADVQLALALLADPPARWESAAAELRGAVGEAPYDPTSPSVREEPYRDTGDLYRLAAHVGPCALCGAPCEGVAMLRPQQDRGVTDEVAFHVQCAAGTRSFDWDAFVERARISLTEGDVAVEAIFAELDGAPPSVKRALEGAGASAVALHGADRKRATREQLRWDLFFTGTVAADDAARLLSGEATWEAGCILTLRPIGKVTTAAFRDQVVSSLTELEALGMHAAHFCEEGDLWASRARSLASVGATDLFPFAFLGRGQHPSPEWRVRVRFRDPAPDSIELDGRFFTEPQVDGRWLAFQSRYAVAKDAPFQDAIRSDLDRVLARLHSALPIEVAILGDCDNEGDGDAWHAYSAERHPCESVLAAAPTFAPRTLSNEELSAICAEAEREHALASEMGDPSSGREALDELLSRIPRAHVRERKRIEALLEDLVRAMVPR